MKLAAELRKILHIGETQHDRVGQVLVLDGADVVGHRVVERLIDAEYPHVRVGMRELLDKQETRGIEMVPFVWEDEDTYTNALKEVKTVFVTTPFKPSDWDKHFPRFLKACTANKVKRVVKMSFYHSIRSKADRLSKHFGDPNESDNKFHNVPFVHKHALCDGDLILHNQLNATILFASHLMSNVFRFGFERKALEENHEFYGASGGKRVNYVSPNDVADVAVKAIFDRTRKRHSYTLTGPAAITDDEVAASLSEQLGTKITYVESPLDFFDEDTAALEKIKATGLEEEFPQGNTKKVLGRDPETFQDYLKATERMSPVEREVFALVSPAPAKEVFSLVSPTPAKKAEEVTVEKEGGEPTKAGASPVKEEEAHDTIKPPVTEDEIEPTETEVEAIEKEHLNSQIVQPKVVAQ